MLYDGICVYWQIGHFLFDLCRWSLNWPWSTKMLGQFVSRIAPVYRSIWRKTRYDSTDKSNNSSVEGLNRHYHKYSSSSYQTRWDISDNVCLNLQHCCYSIYHLHCFLSVDTILFHNDLFYDLCHRIKVQIYFRDSNHTNFQTRVQKVL